MIKKKIIIFAMLCGTSLFSQRAVLGVGGGSMTDGGGYVSHSIGQQGITGVFTGNNGTVVQQGFETSLLRILSSSTLESPVQVTTNVYPNPFAHTVHFSFSSPLQIPLKVVVFDDLGRKVFEKIYAPANTLAVPLANLSGGIYTVRITGAGYQHSTRIVKIHD